MAQLLLISAITKTDNNNINDVVGVYNDTENFTVKERSKFTIATVEGTREEVAKQMESIIGLTMAWKATTVEWSLERPEQKLLWADGESLKEVAVKPTYLVSYVDGKFVNNVAKNPLNATILLSAKIKDIKP